MPLVTHAAGAVSVVGGAATRTIAVGIGEVLPSPVSLPYFHAGSWARGLALAGVWSPASATGSSFPAGFSGSRFPEKSQSTAQYAVIASLLEHPVSGALGELIAADEGSRPPAEAEEAAVEPSATYLPALSPVEEAVAVSPQASASTISSSRWQNAANAAANVAFAGGQKHMLDEVVHGYESRLKKLHLGMGELAVENTQLRFGAEADKARYDKILDLNRRFGSEIKTARREKTAAVEQAIQLKETLDRAREEFKAKSEKQAALLMTARLEAEAAAVEAQHRHADLLQKACQEAEDTAETARQECAAKSEEAQAAKTALLEQQRQSAQLDAKAAKRSLRMMENELRKAREIQAVSQRSTQLSSEAYRQVALPPGLDVGVARCGRDSTSQPLSLLAEPVAQGVCGEGMPCTCGTVGFFWGCAQHCVYSGELLLAHREQGINFAMGPPGLDMQSNARTTSSNNAHGGLRLVARDEEQCRAALAFAD